MVILFTVFTFFGFLNYSVNSANADIFEELNKVSKSYDIHLNLDNLASLVKDYNRAYVVLFSIPNILVCIGLWRVRNTCIKSQSGLNIKAFGFLKIMLIVTFVTSILALIARGVFLSKIVNCIQFFENNYNDLHYMDQPYQLSISKNIISSLISGIIFAIGVAITLMSIYYAKILKTFKTISNTVESGVPSDYISMFVVIMNYVYAFFSLFSLSESMYSFFANSAYIAFLVIMSVLLLKYRDGMRVVIYQHRYDFNGTSNTAGFNTGMQ